MTMTMKTRALARGLAALLAGGLAATAPAADRTAPERGAHAASAPVVSTLAEARACDLVDDGLDAQRDALDAEHQFNEAALAQLQGDGDRLDTLQRRLDNRDRRAVDDFNAQVHEHNATGEAINARADIARRMQADYDAAVIARNHRCGDLVLKDPDYLTWKKERAAHVAARAKAKAAAASAAAAAAAAAASAVPAPVVAPAAPAVPPAPKTAGLQA